MQEKTLCHERKVVNNLTAIGLNRPRGLHRVVVGKPFGEVIESGQLLDQLLHRLFSSLDQPIPPGSLGRVQGLVRRLN